MTYNMDVGDEYNRQFDAVDDEHAKIEARHEAIITGRVCVLYRGPMLSGQRPIYIAERRG